MGRFLAGLATGLLLAGLGLAGAVALRGEDAGASPAAARAVLQARPADAVVVQNYYFPKPGKEEAVHELRLHASDVREELGLPRGAVLRRVEGPDSLPLVIWQNEYASVEERRRDSEAAVSAPAFQEVMDEMGTLLRHFERALWEARR